MRANANKYFGRIERAKADFDRAHTALLRAQSVDVFGDQDTIFGNIYHLLYATGLQNDPSFIVSRIDHALNHGNEIGALWYQEDLLRGRGRYLLRASARSFSDAEVALKRSLGLAQERMARTAELLASLDLARLYCDTGRTQEAVPLLQVALVGFTKTPELPEIERAQRLLASLA